MIGAVGRTLFGNATTLGTVSPYGANNAAATAAGYSPDQSAYNSAIAMGVGTYNSALVRQAEATEYSNALANCYTNSTAIPALANQSAIIAAINQAYAQQQAEKRAAEFAANYIPPHVPTPHKKKLLLLT